MLGIVYTHGKISAAKKHLRSQFKLSTTGISNKQMQTMRENG